MELTCELAALAYRAVYETFNEKSWRPLAADRLERLGSGNDTIQRLRDGYQAIWELQVRQSSGSIDALWPVTTKHALLATWVLAGLRRLRRPSEEFSAQIRDRVAAEVEKRFGEVAIPDMLRPTVIAWTLGQVRGRLDARLPAVPAIAPPDPDVALAYSGLVIHLLNLQAVGQPWPEVAGSANLWRAAGIIDGLKTHPRDRLAAAIKEGMAQLRDVTTPAVMRELTEYWEDFRKSRNSLTHICNSEDGYKFREVAERSGRWAEIELSIRGVTYFLFSDISLRIIEDNQLVTPATLSEVINELDDWKSELTATRYNRRSSREEPQAMAVFRPGKGATVADGIGPNQLAEAGSQ